MKPTDQTTPPPVQTPTVPTPVVPVAPAAPTQTTVAVPATPTAPVSSTPVAVEGVKPKMKFSLPNMTGMKEKFQNMPRKYKIIIIWVAIMFVLLIIASFTSPGRRVKQLIAPTPSPIPTVEPVGEVFVPSPYAQDAELLEIEKNIQTYDGKLGTNELRDDTLRVPSVDWNVNFKN